MKGISHFTSAIAAATFIPGVVALASQEHSLILLLAGVFGLLPDWLDFKIARYFEPADEDVAPNALDFNAQALADKIADALRRAFDEDDPLTVQLHTAQLGPDRWRRYSLQFDPEQNEIILRPGPLINGSGFAVAEFGNPGPIGRARAIPRIQSTYDSEMLIETLEGPSFEFRREGEAVEISFLPWHRRWSHSLVLAAVFGLACGALFGEMAGWVAGVAFATHVLEDQLGHLGSNLWWPFTQRRGAGLQWMHSGDPLPNFITVLTAGGLILYNLNRFATPSLYNGNAFLLWGVFAPAVVGLIIYAARKPRQRPQRLRAAQAEDILGELQETEAE